MIATCWWSWGEFCAYLTLRCERAAAESCRRDLDVALTLCVRCSSRSNNKTLETSTKLSRYCEIHSFDEVLTLS